MHELVIIIAKYFIVLSAIGIALVFLRLAPARRWTFILHAVLSAIVVAILMKIASSLHQDPRPFVRDGVVPYFTHANDNGFPSDHTVAASFCGFLALCYARKTGIVLLVLAVLIGASRVIAGVHHGQDIVAGFVISGIAVVVGFYAAKYVAPLILRNKTAQTDKKADQ